MPSRRGGDQTVLCLLEELDDLIPIDGRKSGQKVVDRLSGLQVVEERLDRHPGAGKDRGAPHHFGVAGNDRLFHAARLLPIPKAVQPQTLRDSSCRSIAMTAIASAAIAASAACAPQRVPAKPSATARRSPKQRTAMGCMPITHLKKTSPRMKKAMPPASSRMPACPSSSCRIPAAIRMIPAISARCAYQ